MSGRAGPSWEKQREWDVQGRTGRGQCLAPNLVHGVVERHQVFAEQPEIIEPHWRVVVATVGVKDHALSDLQGREGSEGWGKAAVFAPAHLGGEGKMGR